MAYPEILATPFDSLWSVQIANIVVPDQNASEGAVWSWSKMFAQACVSIYLD